MENNISLNKLNALLNYFHILTIASANCKIDGSKAYESFKIIVGDEYQTLLSNNNAGLIDLYNDSFDTLLNRLKQYANELNDTCNKVIETANNFYEYFQDIRKINCNNKAYYVLLNYIPELLDENTKLLKNCLDVI